MKLLEFFESLDVDEFIDYYVKYYDTKIDRDIAKNCFLSMIDSSKLNHNSDSDVDTNDIYTIYSIPYVGCCSCDTLDTFLIKNLFEDEERYSYDLSSTNDILHYNISDACRYFIKNDLEYASSIFYELTFLSYDEEEKDICSNNILDEVNNAVEDIKNNNTSSYIPFEEFVSEHYNWVDKRTIEEKDFDYSMVELHRTYSTNLIKYLVKLDKSYVNKNC